MVSFAGNSSSMENGNSAVAPGSPVMLAALSVCVPFALYFAGMVTSDTLPAHAKVSFEN